jgi:hypothetical protein
MKKIGAFQDGDNGRMMRTGTISCCLAVPARMALFTPMEINAVNR